MDLLVLCPHFAPDTAPTGTVMTAIARGLVDLGHRLHVVTALPWYTGHTVEPEWRGRMWRTETTSWGRITRVHPFPTDKRNIRARAAGFAGFVGLASVLAALTPRRPDAVLAMSPPLPIGLAGMSVARLRGAPFVFNIQDVFPDVAVELGLLTNRHVIRAAAAAERFTYRHADAVTVLSDDLHDNVAAKIGAQRGRRRTRVEVIPNFVDIEAIRPSERDNAYRQELGITGRTVVMYAGNVGFSQSLELLLGAARELERERPDVVFVINGGGAARPALEAEVNSGALTNVRFVDYQPIERLPEVLAAADIHVVPLKRGLARASVPSKLYSILASGRPVLASVDAGTEVARTLERANAGVSVEPEDPSAFVAALRAMLDDPARTAERGRNGRAFVESWVSPAAVAQTYERLFAELAAGRGRRS
jgi:colanic acid biosynthesis glycosyl transferase WcaI